MNKDLKFRVFFFLVLFSGFLLRWVFFASSSFPLHDGGLFYVMVGDLIDNGFRLPAITSYNGASIPFLYPPLGLYIAGWLETILKTDRLQLFRILPLVLSIAAIPAFYFLAMEALKEKWTALAAMAVFSILPLSYAWVIMGGGVTRAFGEVFCLLALAFILRFLRSSHWQDLLPAAIFCGFTVLSHPEWALFLFYSAGLLCAAAVIEKRGRGVILSLAILIGTILITSPWLAGVTSAHGGSLSLPLLDSGFNRGSDIARFITISWTNEPFFPVLTMLAIAGLVAAARRKMWILVAWLPLVFFLQGRAADQKAVVPLALLGGLGIAALHRFLSARWSAWEGKRLAYFAAGLVWVYAMLGSFLYVNQLIKPVRASFLEGVNWFRETTPQEATFLVISGETWEKDKYSEWIAALSGRRSLNVVQGYEWLPGFSTRIDRFNKANAAYAQGGSRLLAWMEENGARADYLVLPKWPGYSAGNFDNKPALHWQDWKDSPVGEIVFENDELIVIKIQ